MKKFQEPQAEVVRFRAADVIATSIEGAGSPLAALFSQAEGEDIWGE